MRVGAMMLLVACCYMTAVKMTHHHSVLPQQEVICVLDGESMSHHEAHHHTSYLPLLTADDHCAICNFKVLKVQKTELATLTETSLKRETIYINPFGNLQKGVSEKKRNRAPPYV